MLKLVIWRRLGPKKWDHLLGCWLMGSAEVVSPRFLGRLHHRLLFVPLWGSPPANCTRESASDICRWWTISQRLVINSQQGLVISHRKSKNHYLSLSSTIIDNHAPPQTIFFNSLITGQTLTAHCKYRIRSNHCWSLFIIIVIRHNEPFVAIIYQY